MRRLIPSPSAITLMVLLAACDPATGQTTTTLDDLPPPGPPPRTALPMGDRRRSSFVHAASVRGVYGSKSLREMPVACSASGDIQVIPTDTNHFPIDIWDEIVVVVESSAPE